MLRAMAFEAGNLNKITELNQVIDDAFKVYKPFLILGKMEAQQTLNNVDIESLIEESNNSEYFTYEERIQVINLVISATGDISELRGINQLRRKHLKVIDVQGASLPAYSLKFDSFLTELKLYIKMIGGFQLTFDHIKEGDYRRTAGYFYDAAVALFHSEIAKELNKSKSTIEEKLNIACKVWEQERPNSMYWSPFFDARRQLRRVTYRLVRLAFFVDDDTGTRVSNYIWELKGLAIGALDLETKLRKL